ncbi:hemerythrin domain-containing protein [Nonomuraea ceibae]|uniref:hemerythrin domain-containing protein n=1 Tax=Nonomuraea ceibae TaxID=1935170 RepID=UPI001C5DE471|nr:hemerythrin domain-containing protein [Nonomuraea ceibae]
MTSDVISLITQDHREVEALFERLRSGQGDQAATAAELHALLTAHSRAEEDRVYPQLDAHHGVEEHKEAEVLLDSLVRAEPGSAEFRQTLQQLEDAVTHHVKEEEDELLPQLTESATPERLRELGQAFKQRRDEELRALTVTGETKAELYEQAQRADIPGRSRMDKQELRDALRQAGT